MEYFSSKFQLITSTAIVLMLSFLLTSCGGGSGSEDGVVIPPTNAIAVLNIITEDGGTYNDGVIIALVGTAIDPEDGDISNNIQWNSNVDGFLGAGSNLDVQLSTGAHTVTASVTDSGNLSANSNITASMNAPSYGEAQLSWSAPTENTDDSTLTDLSGFKIYYGQSAVNLNQSITISDAGATTFLVQSLVTETTFYFAVTAVNSLGIESELSNVSSKFIQG